MLMDGIISVNGNGKGGNNGGGGKRQGSTGQNAWAKRAFKKGRGKGQGKK